jgi:hypothetical protein
MSENSLKIVWKLAFESGRRGAVLAENGTFF